MPTGTVSSFDLSIILVHWNTPGLLSDCLESILRFEPKLSYEVIVLDNASPSGSGFEGLRAKFARENFRFERLSENIGFGRASNRGAALSQGEVLLFLGPDVRLTSEGTLSRTLATYRRLPDAGALSCRLLNQDGSPQQVPSTYPLPSNLVREWWSSIVHLAKGGYRKFTGGSALGMEGPPLERVQVVVAHFLMVSRDIFMKTQGFPEEIFLFGEDLELCKRLEDLGYGQYLLGDEAVVHMREESVKNRYGPRYIHLIMDSMVRFTRRHFGAFQAFQCGLVLSGRATWNLLFLTPLCALFVPKSLGDHLSSNARILWHFLAYQWRPHALQRIRAS